MAYFVFGISGHELGGGISGVGDIDVGGFDDVASNFRAIVGTKHGRINDGGSIGGVGMWLCRFIAVVSSPRQHSIWSNHSFILWCMVCDFGAVWRKQWHYREITTQKTPQIKNSTQYELIHFFRQPENGIR